MIMHAAWYLRLVALMFWWHGMCAQELQPNTCLYLGTLGSSDLLLHLEKKDSALQGTMRSGCMPNQLSFTGDISEAGQWSGPVSDSLHHTVMGSLACQFQEAGIFSGTFISADTQVPLPIAAEEIAATIYYDLQQNPWYHLTGNYPVFSHTEALYAHVNQFISQEIHSLTSSFLSIPAERRPDAHTMEQHCIVEVFHYSEHLASMLLTQETYTGGAHGNTDYRPLTWAWIHDAPRRLELADLFTNALAAVTEIKAQCYADLQRQNASGAAAVTMPDNHIFDNFAVSTNGLHIFFMPYTVGCFAEGAFQVTLPWPQLLPWIDQHGLLAEVLPNHAPVPPPAQDAAVPEPTHRETP